MQGREIMSAASSIRVRGAGIGLLGMVLFCCSAGCKSADVPIILEPQVIDVPMLADNTSFAGLWPPDLLSPRVREAFLNSPMPRPADVPAAASLVAVFEEHTGKKVILEQLADEREGRRSIPLASFTYRGCYLNPYDPSAAPQVRDIIGALLARAGSTKVAGGAGSSALLIEGEVLDRAGRPIPGVKIELMNDSGTEETFTDSQGRFQQAMGESELRLLRVKGHGEVRWSALYQLDVGRGIKFRIQDR
jgi:hypothetical protein